MYMHISTQKWGLKLIRPLTKCQFMHTGVNFSSLFHPGLICRLCRITSLSLHLQAFIRWSYILWKNLAIRYKEYIRTLKQITVLQYMIHMHVPKCTAVNLYMSTNVLSCIVHVHKCTAVNLNTCTNVLLYILHYLRPENSLSKLYKWLQSRFGRKVAKEFAWKISLNTSGAF